MRLGAEFFGRAVLDVAPDLLGRRVVSRSAAGVVTVELTEVEAYAGPDDPGSHARRGPTPRSAVMFGPPAHLYVYFSYGMHWCVNLVCGPAGTACAVLLRAGRVVEGHDLARQRRTTARGDRDLARGPARLAAALGIDGALDGAPLVDAVEVHAVEVHAVEVPAVEVPAVEVQGQPAAPASIRTGPRVGVSGAGGDGATYPWRFWLDGEPTVSAYRPGVVRGERLGGAPSRSGTLGADGPVGTRPATTRGRP
ncbi:MAG: DNA-3-methyladenine glycosylase [Rhodoferax sp.]|nr:DNA-3-methyladenine glycosylase [Actinomycetota bacterium]